MARFAVADAEKYGGQGGGGYFSLKNDKETARVRILMDSIEDIEGYAVHEVKIDEKKRYVNCLREYGQPMDVCPMCAARMFTTAKFFVPLYNITEDRVQTWERGKKFGQKLTSLCSRYPNLVTHEFEIERNGKPGDQQTSYELYECSSDPNVSLDDFEAPEILGTLILDKNADEMQYFLDRGVFPDNETPNTRRGTTQPSAQSSYPTGRRVPPAGGRERVPF